jgi:hypothetical protein
MKLKDKLILHANTSHSLPTALESEMYVLGSVMLLEGAVQSVFEHLRHWHFYFDKNVVIWKAVTRLVKKNKSITKDLLFAELYKKAFFEGEIEMGYLQQCIDKCGKGSEVVNFGVLRCHKEEMIDTWSRRRMIDLGHTIQYWGFLPGGYCEKQFKVFENRKERIQAIQENVINADDDCKPFDPDGPIEMPDFTLSILSGGKKIGLAEQGNIVAVSGGTGSRKTVIVSAIVASMFSSSFIGFKQQDRGDVLFFDTEQPKKTFDRIQRRLYQMCNRKNRGNKYKAWPLRSLSPLERIKRISKEIRRWKGDIGLIVIDGVLDLVSSMNDVPESTAAVQALMSWTEETGATILCVLHDVRSSNKMGGHLGSLLERKIDVEINSCIAEDPLYSEISFRKTRNSIRPRSFLFTQDSLSGWPTLAPKLSPQEPNYYEDDVPF